MIAAKPKGSQRGDGEYTDVPIVAIIGRPNVGKSTLFNRMVRGRIAIVDDEPGVTRDRNYRETNWAGKRFFVVDTGGLVPGSKDTLESLVRKQVEQAIGEAVLVVLVVDAADGVTPLDHEIAELVRKSGKEHLIIANKIDTKKGRAQAPEFYELGLGDFMSISAEHGTNVTEVLDTIAEKIPAIDTEAAQAAAIAVVGRPNVGKSSLINRWTGAETAIVHEKPGTTRDSIDTLVKTGYGILRFVDTAGLRRRAKADTNLERHANIRAVRAIDRSDVVVLMLDPAIGIAKHDLTVASYVHRSGKGMVLTWNKWDHYSEQDKARYLGLARRRFRHMSYLPVIFISCLTGDGLDAALDTCVRISANRDTRIPTGVLNRMLLHAVGKKPPPGKGRRFPRIYYAAQTGCRPPSFTLFVNDPSLFSASYKRSVEKTIRGLYSFEGTPLRIRVRKSE